MKKGEKRVILILIIITVILIVVAVRVKSGNSEDSSTTQDGESVTVEESTVSVLEDGTKLNTSSALQETKTLDDGLKVSDFQLTESGNVTLLLATITNSTGSTQGGYPVNITFLDSDGNQLTTLSAYIPEIEDGGSEQLSTNTTFDYSDAYDITITKQ